MAGEIIATSFKIDPPNPVIYFISSQKWYKRLWYFLSNPFLYLFVGKVRF